MLANLRTTLNKISLFIYTHRHICMVGGFFILVVVFGTFFLTKPAHASNIIDWPDFGDSLIRTLSKIFLSISRLFLKIALFFLEYIIIIAGYNGYLDSTAVNVGWVAVLNITNMFFVVILLIIAFATILGKDEYEWKKLLPKFFLAAIIVNFSRTICGVLIDASQVIMTAFVNAIAATVGGNVINAFQLDKIEKFNSQVKPGELLSPGIFTASLAAVFFSAMVMAVFGAYIFILVGRLIRLWILIVLSPLAFVLSVIPKTESFAGQWWSELGDNLVTGPVLLFFIWLSLVTVGSGQINAHILQRSNVPDSNKATMDGTLYDPNFINVPKDEGAGRTAEQSAGLTDILGWNNMANFIIAIGMLFAGAQVASRIGGSSGNLMMSAVNFGKKVATVATGVAAGQWAYGKVAGAAEQIPGYIGGIATAPLARFGSKASSLYRAKRAMVGKRQNEIAKSWESATGWKKPLGWVGARLIETSKRKDKVVEDYADLAEEAEKIEKINTSTSEIGAAPAKLRMTELARQEEEKAAAKKGQKLADEQKLMEGRMKAIEEIEKKLKASGISDKEALAEALKKAVVGGAQFDVKKKDKKTGKEIEEKETLTRRDWDYFESRNAALKGAAQSEQVKEDLHDHHAVEVAKARDKYLEDTTGSGGGFEDEARMRIAKKYMERQDVAGYDQSMAKVVEINRKIALVKDEKQRDIMQKAVNNLLLSQANRGSMFGVSGEHTALATAIDASGKNLQGYNVSAELDENNKQNLVNAQANFLATKLGKTIKNSREAVTEAVKELDGKMGTAFMIHMSDITNKMAEDGAAQYAGLFKGEMIEGKYKIRATDYDRKDAKGNFVDRDFIDQKREWAISQSKFSKINGFDAAVDQEWDGKSMNTRINSKKALDNLAKIFDGINSNQLSRLDNNNVDTLARAIQNSKSKSERDAIFEALKEASSDQNTDKFVEQMKEKIKRSIHLTNKALLDEVNTIAQAAATEAVEEAGQNSTQNPPPQKRNQNKRPKRGR